MSNENYGLQLTLMATRIKNKELLSDTNFIAEFLVDLVARISMRVLAGPLVAVETGLPEKQGCSGVIILYESHAAVHTYSHLGTLFLDIFSCKMFAPGEVASFLRETFGDIEIAEETSYQRGRDWDQNIERELKGWAEKK